MKSNDGTHSLGTRCEEVRAALRRPGTSFGEAGLRVSVRPEAHEHVEFYRSDDDLFRELFDCERVCDLIIHRFSVDAPERPVIAYVELKGSDVEYAATQLTDAVLSSRNCIQRFRPAARRRALVVVHGSAPRKDDKMRRDFRHETGLLLEVNQWLKGR